MPLLQGEFIGTFLFVFLATTGAGTALAIGVSYTVASEPPVLTDAVLLSCLSILPISAKNYSLTLHCSPVQAMPWRRCPGATSIR